MPVTLAALAGLAYGATAVTDVPPPHVLYRMQTTEPSRSGEAFPSRPVAAGTASPLPAAPAPPPREVPWKGGRLPFTEFLDITHTKAFVVLRDGGLAYE